MPNEQSFTIDEDTSVPVTLSGTDPDGFSYTVGDGRGGIATAVVTVVVK